MTFFKPIKSEEKIPKFYQNEKNILQLINMHILREIKYFIYTIIRKLYIGMSINLTQIKIQKTINVNKV